MIAMVSVILVIVEIQLFKVLQICTFSNCDGISPCPYWYFITSHEAVGQVLIISKNKINNVNKQWTWHIVKNGKEVVKNLTCEAF